MSSNCWRQQDKTKCIKNTYKTSFEGQARGLSAIACSSICTKHATLSVALTCNFPLSLVFHTCVSFETICAGKGEPVPEHPYPGQQWKEVRHDKTVTWLAFWKDTLSQKDFKYVWLAANSTFKSDSDLAKYEKARKLKVRPRNAHQAVIQCFVLCVAEVIYCFGLVQMGVAVSDGS